jgi:hypothetical protein
MTTILTINKFSLPNCKLSNLRISKLYQTSITLSLKVNAVLSIAAVSSSTWFVWNCLKFLFIMTLYFLLLLTSTCRKTNRKSLTTKSKFEIATITLRQLTLNTILDIIRYLVGAYYTMLSNISLVWNKWQMIYQTIMLMTP